MGAYITPSPVGCDCLTFLDKAVSLLDNFEDSFFIKEKKKLLSLRNRFLQGRLNLAVLGQFKRGKSSLLNALLGIDILPTSVIPLTAIPTFLTSGDIYSARILFDSEKSDLLFSHNNYQKVREFIAEFVTEEKNPRNEKKVREVVISIPGNSLLEKKIVFIDTPGIGSTYKHNTEATLNFLPQCDAAFFVISPDPPITEAELDFLRSVKEKVPKLFFVLNKADYLNEEEKKDILNFLEANLAKSGIDVKGKIFPVSAKHALEAKLNNDFDLLKKSGVVAIEKHLIEFLANEKNNALAKAIAIKILNSLSGILLNVDLKIKSLKMPFEILEKKRIQFEEKIKELTIEKQAILDILNGDNKRIHLFLEEYSASLRERSETYFEGIVKELIASSSKKEINESNIREILAEKIPVFFEKEMRKTTELFEDKVGKLLNRHKEKANRLISSLKEIAANLFEVSYTEFKEDRFFELIQQPYWVTYKWNATFNPIPPNIVDKMLPLKVKNNRILNRLKQQIHTLTVSNIENLRWSIFQSIDKSFRSFERVLEDGFQTAVNLTYGAVKVAFVKRIEEKEKVKNTLKNLEKVRIELEAMLKEIKGFLEKID